MDDSGIHDALRVLGPREIDAIERFVQRLQRAGWIRPDAARRWQVALDRTQERPPLRLATPGRN
jgi:hypothetical protein